MTGNRNSALTNNPRFFDNLYRYTVGFDNLFKDFDARVSSLGTNYPPYNMVQKGEHQVVIEMALAGFVKNEIRIEKDGNQLIVQGKKDTQDTQEVDYIHKGISTKPFELSWTMADHVSVTKAEFADGILTIELTQEIPEEEKPQQIEIL